jgi:uncharacterized protein DUF4232
LEFPKHLIVRRAPLALLAGVALMMAACGSSSSSSSHATAATNPATASTPAPATAAASPSTTTTTPQPTPTTATSTTSSGASLCRAGDLALSFLGGQGATGHGELGFALRNTSSQPCTTIGYPGIQFLDRSGRALPTIPTHTTYDFFGSVPKAELTVAPGSTVSFRLGVTHGAASTAGCTTAYGLQVIPPNDTTTLRVTLPNGAYECQTATVSPVAQGTSAYT